MNAIKTLREKPATGARRTLDGITLLERCEFAEYAGWYLDREIRKGRRFSPPTNDAERLAQLSRNHPGKTLKWFSEAMWWRARIETPEALAQVMIVSSRQSRIQGLIDDRRTRTLGVAVDRLLASGFFKELDYPGLTTHPFHRYYNHLRNGQLVLQREERLVVRSLSVNERKAAPQGVQLYLHDGVGRGVPYLTLLRQGRLQFRPIDVYAALVPQMLQKWPGAVLRHRTGEARHGSWRCRKRRHQSGYATFGPYTSLPGSTLTVRFRLMADPADQTIATLDVHDAFHGKVLASRPINSGGVWDLTVENPLRSRLEFRVNWHGRVTLEIKSIEVWLGCVSRGP